MNRWWVGLSRVLSRSHDRISCRNRRYVARNHTLSSEDQVVLGLAVEAIEMHSADLLRLVDEHF